MSSKSRGARLARGVRLKTLAIFTTASTRPKRSTTCETAAPPLPPAARSAAIASPCPPRASTSSIFCSIAARLV